MAKLLSSIAGIALMIASLPADARSSRRLPARPAPVAAQEDKSSAEKASADIDKAMNRRMKNICRGC
jgi:hypothetical protein